MVEFPNTNLENEDSIVPFLRKYYVDEYGETCNLSVRNMRCTLIYYLKNHDKFLFKTENYKEEMSILACGTDGELGHSGLSANWIYCELKRISLNGWKKCD